MAWPPEAPRSHACFAQRRWRKQQKLVSAIAGAQSQVESSAQMCSVKEKEMTDPDERVGERNGKCDRNFWKGGDESEVRTLREV